MKVSVLLKRRRRHQTAGCRAERGAPLMASRRRRSRRSWGNRLRRELIPHRTSVFRSVLGVALLAAVWLLWPGPGHRVPDQRDAAGAGQQSVAGGELNDGLVA